MAARRKLANALAGAVVGLLLAAAPFGIDVDGWSTEAAAAPAGAGQGNGGNNGSPGGSNSGGGNAGGNSGGSQAGSNSSGKSSDKAGNRGRGTEVFPRFGFGLGWGNRGTLLPSTIFSDDFGRRSNEHINPVTGIRIEINGSNVEVLHLDGIFEEITDGRYRMNDAQGRMIIERNATEGDRARVRAMITFR